MHARSLVASGAVALLSCALLAQAPAPAAPPASGDATADPVIAKVDGDAIHSSDLLSAIQSLPPEYRNMPTGTLYPMLLDQLVDQRALVVMAHKQGLDQDPGVRRQMARAAEQTLQTAVISREVGPSVTDAAVHARYDQEIAGKPGETEVHARHILVAGEDEATKLIAELKAGGDFAALAKAHSTDPGASQGGDLGYFKRGEMVPEFAETAFSLKPGEVADKPVHTRFGWHVIQALDVRQAPAPGFEQVRDELRQRMIQEGVAKVLASARAGVKVQKFNADGSPQRATDLAEPPAPAASGAPVGGITPQPRK